MRKFEKITFKQFVTDISNEESVYNSYELPTRSTKNSAGYDFKAITNFIIKPGESLKVPTGIKAITNEDEVLMIFVRSSMGVKHNIRMLNTVGIIDGDYYDNPSNEGHIFINLKNDGSTDYIVKSGDGIGQGMFTKFLIVDDELEINQTRSGGFGSTNKEAK